MADNKYKIIISAEIKDDSKKSIENQIKKFAEIKIEKISLASTIGKSLRDQIQDAINKDGAIEIKEIKVSGVTKPSKISSGSKPAPSIVSETSSKMGDSSNVESLKEKVLRAISDVGGNFSGKITVNTIFDEKNVEIVDTITALYKDQVGSLHEMVFGWKLVEEEEKKELVFAQKKAKYVDDENKQQEILRKTRESYISQIDKAIQKSDQLIEKTKNKSPYAQEVIDVKNATFALKEKAQTLLSLDYISPEQMEEFKLLENEVYKSGAALASAGKNIQSWGTEIGVAIKRTIEWATAMTLLYGTIRQVQAGLQYVAELNKQMVSIQAVTGQTNEEINKMAREYNNLAKQMGVTTLDVSKGSLEFIRQGKSASETQELLKGSLMMSKLAAIDAAQSTEYMTSIMNGFNFEAKDMINILDTLVSLDNNYATSVAEISSAMQKTSVSAQQAGITFEELASYITVISSVSRQSAESIGTSLKTIFARLTDVKLGKLLDQEGESISNVEEVLKKHQISIRDSNMEFRNMGDVIDEIGKKWKTFGEIEQSEILKAIAGTYQREKALILFENYNKVLEAQRVASSEAGIAQERYAVVLDSVESAQNRMTDSWQRFWQEGINAELIKNFYNISSAILDLINAFGGLSSVLPAISSLFILMNVKSIAPLLNSTRLFVTAILDLYNILPKVSAALGALELTEIAGLTAGFGLALIAVTALGAGLYYLSRQAERNAKAFEESSVALSKTTQDIRNIENETEKVKDLWKEYERLKSLQENTKGGLKGEDLQSFVDVQNQLHSILPEISGSYDSQLNFIIDQKTSLNDILEIERQILETKREQAKEDIKNTIKAGAETFEDKLNKLKTTKIEAERTVGSGVYGISMAEREKNRKNYEIALKDYNDFVMSFKTLYKSMGKDERETFLYELDPGKTRKDLRDLITQFEGEILESQDKIQFSSLIPKSTPKDIENVEKLKLQYGDLIDNLGKMNDAVKSIDFTATLKNSLEDGRKLFSDLTNEASTTFNQINSNFSKGNVDSEQFLQSISNIIDTYSQIGEYAVSNAEDLGIQTNQVNNLKTTLSNLTIAQSQLNATQSLSVEIANAQAQVQGGVLPQEVAQGLAKIILDSGITFQILAQNGANTSQQIIRYLTTVVGGFDALTLEASKSTNGYLNSVANNLGIIQKIFGLGNIGKMSTYFPVGSGGISPSVSGGGGGGKSAEQIRLEKETKALEDKKKALQDTLDVFNKYIESQKEALKLQKEEKEFTDELAAKNKSLAKLKSDIAILALDDSEEAKAQRIKLEEDASKAEEEINKLSEDRKYQVQIDTLDKQKKDFEDNINSQIKALDDKINKIKEEQSAIQQTGGSVGGLSDQFSNMAENANSQIDTIISKLRDLRFASIDNIGVLESMINRWLMMGKSVYDTTLLAQGYLDMMTGRADKPGYVTKMPAGMAQPHHDGVNSGFVGGLNSNEEFAKLLKGELVLNPRDMDRFTKTTLPSIVGNASSYGGASFSMPITVNGNLDSTVLPDIEKIAGKVINVINNSMKNRGYIRNSNLVSI